MEHALYTLLLLHSYYYIISITLLLLHSYYYIITITFLLLHLRSQKGLPKDPLGPKPFLSRRSNLVRLEPKESGRSAVAQNDLVRDH